jgi:hypothetical protein
MFARIIIAALCLSAVATATEVQPGRCVLVSEPNQPQRLLCQPLVEGCKARVSVKADGTIVTKTTCVYTSAR